MMSYRDLDGDMYFVCWEPTLLPPATVEPLKRSPTLSAAQITSRQLRSDDRQPTRMAQSAIETFIQLRFNRLLGRMANEWQRQAEKTSMLANAELPLQLVPLIESALVRLLSFNNSAFIVDVVCYRIS